MVDGLKLYPAYKDSGVPWLGAVPEHWGIERAKWLFRKVDRPVREQDEVVTCFRDGVVSLRKNRRVRGFTESLKEIGYQGIRRGDLVIHAMDAFAGAIGVADSDGKGTPVYAVCEPGPGANAYYYAYIVREMARNQWIQALAKGIRERSTDFRFDGFGSQPVPLPPLSEQAAIVHFLDHADRRTRLYIRAKQKLIKLLEEQKQAIIHRAVTRGLDPSVRLKPSGVEWLGDVPEDWAVKRLKWVTRLQRGYDLPAEQRISGSFPVVSSGGVIDFHCEARSRGPGVVMGRYGSTDAVFFLETDFWPHNTALFVTNFHGNRPRWCYFMLRTISKADHAGKSAVPGVDRKDLFEIVVTILSEETDPNKLHDLKSALDGYQVYAVAQVDALVELYLGGADRDKLDPILDACVAVYKEQLDEDGQVDFKGEAKAFIRAYGFLSSILPYTNAEWEKLSIFLNFLVPKLPAPVEEDLAKGILEAIDMDSYRVEKQAAVKIQLPDADAEIDPVPADGGGRKPEPELDRLSNILKTFNDQFGNIPWTDADRVHKLITEDIPNRVAADTAYQNAKKNSDKQNARIEHDKALARVMTAVLKDDTQLFKQFMDNESFRRWMTDTVFGLTYEPSGEDLRARTRSSDRDPR